MQEINLTSIILIILTAISSTLFFVYIAKIIYAINKLDLVYGKVEESNGRFIKLYSVVYFINERVYKKNMIRPKMKVYEKGPIALYCNATYHPERSIIADWFVTIPLAAAISIVLGIVTIIVSVS